MNTATSAARPPSMSRHGSEDRRFFLAAAVAVAAIVFAGFAPTYYLKAWFGTPPLSLLVHAHGLIMTAWIALFLTQTLLAATGRIGLHRRLGLFGAVLAVLIVVVGLCTTFTGTVREVHADPDSRTAQFYLVLLVFDPVILLVFGGLVAAAIALRKRGDWHKRLMLLATLCLLGPPISRFDFLPDATSVFLAWDACVLAGPVIDTIRHRRLHPAFAWGVPIFLLSEHLTYLFAKTQVWMQFARSLVS
ncbi:MAG: hypothetical protein QM741_16240 [Rudaea sp.]|uniref:hypothetical protein n=1 Tax=Rudaea sp. TaxID=2136325 RepID=UPI0039E488DC